MINLAIIISGRGSNMKAILSSILSGNIKNVNPAVVISNRKDAIGLEVAKNNFNIPTEIVLSNGKKGWDYDKEIVSQLRSYNVLPSNGLICLAGYMKIISTEFVNEYKFRIMNIHPALLPSFKGLHAQKQALDYGVKVSGCTVHFVDDGVD
ncbi:MAG: phosphoribosylglycinamide formyltransferase, partial [Nitrososphaerales archaeon]